MNQVDYRFEGESGKEHVDDDMNVIFFFLAKSYKGNVAVATFIIALEFKMFCSNGTRNNTTHLN